MYQLFDNQIDQEAHLISLIGQPHVHLISIFDRNLSLCASKAIVEALEKYLLTSRKNEIVIVVQDDAPLRKEMTRLFNLMKKFSHAFFLYRLDRQFDYLEDSFVLAHHSALIKPVRTVNRGSYFYDEEHEVRPYDMRFKELLESSERVAIFDLGL